MPQDDNQPPRKKRGRPPREGDDAPDSLRISATAADAAWFRDMVRTTGLPSGALLSHLIQAYRRPPGAPPPPPLRRLKK